MNIIYDTTTFGIYASVLKSFRIFRILFFTESLEPLNFMIESFAKTFVEIGAYIYIIVVVGLIFALIG